MGHDKLRKFAENETFACLVQPEASEVIDKTGDRTGGLKLNDHPLKGHWNERMFAKAQPIVLELGCGKGEYTIDLSRRVPECNYIGVDIKGARLWKGAKHATLNHLPNVAFLRTRIEFIESFFAPEEVSEIWLTFSDPQLKRENNRLTSPLFLERYRRILKPGGIVRLKTDSRFLHEYSKAVAQENGLEILDSTTDLYGEACGGPVTGGDTLPPGAAAEQLRGKSDVQSALYEVQTFYERMFLAQGYKITYLAFRIDHDGPYSCPQTFDSAWWRHVEGPRKMMHIPDNDHEK